MRNPDAERLFMKGLEYFNQGQHIPALGLFERALQVEDNACYYSYLGLCIARERGQVRKGIELCEEAIAKDPDNPAHYLNLGRIFLFMNDRERAITVFREGLRHGTDQKIIDELDKLQTRKPPVVPFLKRDHPVNKFIGILLKLLRVR